MSNFDHKSIAKYIRHEKEEVSLVLKYIQKKCIDINKVRTTQKHKTLVVFLGIIRSILQGGCGLVTIFSLLNPGQDKIISMNHLALDLFHSVGGRVYCITFIYLDIFLVLLNLLLIQGCTGHCAVQSNLLDCISF